MRLLVVIFAAIGALALAAQAYFMWTARTHADSERIHMTRVSTCGAVLESLDQAGAVVEGFEERYQAALLQLKKRSAGGDGPPDDRLEVLAVHSALRSTGPRYSFARSDPYFSEAELEKMGVPELSELPRPFDIGTAEEATEALEKYRAAAAKYESAKSVCVPIMLGKAR